MALGGWYGTAFPIWNDRIRSSCRIRVMIYARSERYGDRSTNFLTVPALTLSVGVPPLHLKLAGRYMKGPS